MPRRFLSPDELAATCFYAEAARGEHTLEDVGLLFNLSRERVRQMETRMLAELQALCDAAGVEP